ncbi:patatin-like protein 1 [Vigna unguiculata]|uniref:patatin-like protein 1 n=1 Tax=Vigna unguiculata TaxID=3917 RepID=UPI0010160109|nr:patatin-like protein 1 [Vigna unguiculata]
MSDISISASAAPTLLPPYYFQNEGVDFNLISDADLSMLSNDLVNGNPLYHECSPLKLSAIVVSLLGMTMVLSESLSLPLESRCS